MSNVLLLHLGTAKTGTSSIQEFLRLNREVLVNQGWCYPDLYSDWNKGKCGIGTPQDPSSRANYPNGYLLYASLEWGWPQRKINKLFRLIKRQLNQRNVIISVETLWDDFNGVSLRHKIKKLKENFPNIKVLVYLRRQDLFIESAWNQGIESNYIWYDIEEYCNSFSRATESTEYLRKIREIADVIGKENIIIRVYERGQLQGDKGDSISDFLEVLKEQGCILENERLIYPKRINTRLNDETLNYALMFNREYYKHAHATMPEIQELFGIMNENSAEQVYSAYLTKEDRVSILNKHREDNEILAKEYLQREDGKLFFDDRIDFPVWNPGQLSKDEERFIILLAQQFAKCSNRIEREKKEASRPLSLIKSFVKFFLNKS